jgi:uncharacterized membrane protein
MSQLKVGLAGLPPDEIAETLADYKTMLDRV